MMVIYLPIKFDFDRTNPVKLESRNQQLMLSNEQNAKKRTDIKIPMANIYVGKSKKYIGTQVCV